MTQLYLRLRPLAVLCLRVVAFKSNILMKVKMYFPKFILEFLLYNFSCVFSPLYRYHWLLCGDQFPLFFIALYFVS